MTDFEEKLNAILSNPEAMAQVASIAQSLGGGTTAQTTKEAPTTEKSHEHPPPPQDAFSSLLGQIDPTMLNKILPLIGQINTPQSGQREQLLYALRPYLKESRRDKIDQALRAARLLRIGKQFLGTLGDGHV